MYQALKLTAKQQSQLNELERERIAAEATFRDLDGQSLQDSRNGFYAERQKKLRRIFNEEQWAIWSSFWSRPRPSTTP